MPFFLSLSEYESRTILLRLTCDEAPEEPSSVSTEQVLKIECNITISTNYMLSGIMNVRIVRYFPSPSLNRLVSLDSLSIKNWRKTRLPLADKRFTRRNHGCRGFPVISQFTWCALHGEQILGRRPKLWLVQYSDVPPFSTSFADLKYFDS